MIYKKLSFRYLKFWLLIVFSLFIFGNIRPPESKLFMSSRSLQKSKNLVFKVSREDLTVSCYDMYKSDEPLSELYSSEDDILKKYPLKKCFIEATYYFFAEDNTNALFFFVLPKRVNVNILVNNKVIEFKKINRDQKSIQNKNVNYDIDLLIEKILKSEDEKEEEVKRKNKDFYMKILKDRVLSYRYKDIDYSLYNVEFESEVKRGENVIYVSYQQPLSFEEMGHGYCYKGTYVNYIKYDVWPIKEWEKTSEFFINLTVRLPKEFNKYNIEGYNKDRLNSVLYNMETNNTDEFIVLRKKIYDKDLPDELIIRFIEP